MIFHASIPADDPEHVTRVLAEIWRAEYFPFVYPGSFVLVPGDEVGTILEVVPRGSEQVPAAVDVGLRKNDSPSRYSEVHLNLSTHLSIDEILAIGRREAWVARECDRNFFKLVELWIENSFLIELMTTAEAARYAEFYRTPENLREALKHFEMPMAQFGFTEEWLTAP